MTTDIEKNLLLTIDIGNTNTVLGIFRNSELIVHWRVSSTVARTEDECWILVKMFCESGKIPFESISGVVISSVVPNQTIAFKRMTENYFYFSPIIVDAELDIGLKILYENPKAVGADRLCNAVAGYHKYSGPLIIVDFGTATTFDVISSKGEYVGGVIAPGIETSAADLFRRAARLFRVELKFPPKVIGRTTESSMQAGIMYGAVEQVDGIVKRIIEELHTKKTVTVIATGGLAPILLNETHTIHHLEPFLTLDGMRLIYERIRRKPCG